MVESGDSSQIRVVLADDHTLFRDGLCELLSAEGIDVVADVPDGDAALLAIAEHSPDVVLLDVQMPGPGPVPLLDRIQRDYPDTRVIFLSMHEPPTLVQDTEARGAAAYLRKTVDREVLSTTIRAAALGMAIRHDRQPAAAADQPAHLTKKESTVLHLVARSYSNRQIAAELYISESTVKRHLTSIYHKLGAVSRVEALSRALRDGHISSLE